MHICTARTALGCTSKTCRDHAHAILPATSACRLFFSRHHTRLPLLASTMAKGSGVGTPENSQPAQCLRGTLGEVSQGGMSVTADPVRGSVTAPCADAVCGAFSS